MAVAVQEDVFKSRHIEVRPHTLNEITQNQMGAVKVMALRALFENEKDPQRLMNDVNAVIQTAKDPTIVEIAKAARESLQKGRPFFKDFLDGIANL
jgi:hypothetical protein